MERTVSDQDGITWSCIEAFTGLSDETGHSGAAQVKGQEGAYWVVCTPSGGAQSVRLKLSGDWQNDYSDEALLQEIKEQSH
ncbi:hypothetical protein H6F51_03515 [Cyanobacteria bacterium FACHB-DQ100]|uniref:hypothetical protein n=1 Tax=Leptolyngbya sp. DQ-M1 TaxID=2933920 RepID=UPI00199239A9|nr:hypothetical protein [Cyanobacteria bacterium FACHB-DQ100]